LTSVRHALQAELGEGLAHLIELEWLMIAITSFICSPLMLRLPF